MVQQDKETSVVASSNPLRRKLQTGKPVFGLLATMPSVPTMQVLMRSGVDFITVDMEHSPIDIQTAHAMIAATNGTEVAPFVRIPWTLGWVAKQALDAGAYGITFPLVKTKEDAERAVAAVRYPPSGDRAWGPFYSHVRWNCSLDQYVATAGQDVLVKVLIEHKDSIDNLEEILSVPGIDIAQITPGDLATSLGLSVGQDFHPDVQALITRAEQIIRSSRVVLGGVAISPDSAKMMVDRGYRLIGIGQDFRFLQRALSDYMNRLYTDR